MTDGITVTVLESTYDPEKLVCEAARGDYYGGYIGDTAYSELMADVDYDNDVADEHGVIEAKTKHFIEQQLSRGHFGPWEHPSITFALENVPVFTERQLIRHRHLSFDVQSMRYADFSDGSYTTPKSLTDSEMLNREQGLTSLDEQTQAECREVYETHMDDAFDTYQTLVDKGVPKEDARGLLGLSTEVNVTVSGNARSFLHVFNLRQKANSQWSIRQLSNKLAEEMSSWMPYTANWWEENGPTKLAP
jgi:thymidylate synthase (FAD)